MAVIAQFVPYFPICDQKLWCMIYAAIYKNAPSWKISLQV